MARRTKAEAETTRQRLLDAAEILFSERGVTATSLTDIADSAGVTRGAIYWHFKNKVDLFEAMHARIRLSVREIETEALAYADPIIGLRDYWTRALLRITQDERRRRVIDILFRKCEYVNEYEAASIRIGEWGCEVIAAMSNVFATAHNLGLMAPDHTPKAAARATYSMITGIVSNWMTLPGLYQDNQDVIDALDLFFGALHTRHPCPPLSVGFP